MQKSQKQVKEFHQKFDLVINDNPTIVDEETLKLRCKLLLEEVKEFCVATGYAPSFDIYSGEPILEHRWEANLIEMADALADIQYVTDGAAISLGIDLEPISDEVHRSNMTKLWKTNEMK